MSCRLSKNLGMLLSFYLGYNPQRASINKKKKKRYLDSQPMQHYNFPFLNFAIFVYVDVCIYIYAYICNLFSVEVHGNAAKDNSVTALGRGDEVTGLIYTHRRLSDILHYVVDQFFLHTSQISRNIAFREGFGGNGRRAGRYAFNSKGSAHHQCFPTQSHHQALVPQGSLA